MLLYPVWKAALAAFPRNLCGILRRHLESRYLCETQIKQDGSSKGEAGKGGGE